MHKFMAAIKLFYTVSASCKGDALSGNKNRE
jgi:hypothetical protein